MDLKPDVVDPGDVDWTQVPETMLCLAVEAGVPQAIDEANRRGLDL